MPNQLVEQFEKYIKGIVSEVDGELDPDRLRQHSLAVQHDNYYRGIANAVPQLDKSDGRIFWGQLQKGDGSEDDVTPRTVNKVRGDGKKFAAVLGQKAPNVKAIADDPKSEADKAAERQGDAAAALLRQWWDIEAANMRLSLGLWKYGTEFGYVRYVADGERFGHRIEPVFGAKTVELEPEHFKCPTCGSLEDPVLLAAEIVDAQTGMVISPALDGCIYCGTQLTEFDRVPAVTTEVEEQIGTRKYPKGRVLMTLANVLQVRVPFNASCIADCGYLCFEYEESKPKLLALYPELRERLKTSSSNESSTTTSSTAATSREQTISITGGQTGRKGKSMMTYSRYWFRPVQFELIEEQSIREQLYDAFPGGVRATYVDGMLVDLAPDSMDDHWIDCPAETGDNIYTDAVCRDMIDFQRAYNDTLTIGMETLSRNMPITIVDQSVVDAKVLAQKRQLPGDILIAKPNPSTPVEKAVAVVPSASLPKELGGFVSDMENSTRETTGILPQIFGGGEGGGTASEYARRSNQALAQLGMQWTYMRRFWTKAFELGVKELSRYAVDDLRVVRGGAGGPEVDTIDLVALTGGNFHFESDEAIPQNWGQQRDQLTFLLGQAPDIVQQLGVTHPQNADVVRTLLGLPMLTSPGADLRDKVLEDIQQLLAESPMPDPMGGPDALPSIEPDPLDDHAIVFEIVRGWLIGETGRREKKRNPQGYENVRAYALSLRQLAMQAAAPPPEEGGPPPDAPPPLPGVQPNPMFSGPASGNEEMLAA